MFCNDEEKSVGFATRAMLGRRESDTWVDKAAAEWLWSGRWDRRPELGRERERGE